MVIDRALSKNPEHRYETAGELANEFMAIFNGQTISPGTLHIAQLAREAAEAERQGKAQPEKKRFSWARFSIEVAVAAIVLLGIFFLVSTRQEASARNLPVGRGRFDFGNTDFDQIAFALNGVKRPGENEHLATWLVYEEGEEPYRDIGALTLDASGVARLEFTDLAGKNLLNGLQEIRITREQDNPSNTTPNATPSGQVVYSSVFPPQALVHIRKIGVSFEAGSDNASLIAGLYYYSGSYPEAAINGDPASDYVGMTEAYENNDEATFRKRNEELVNMIVGEQSEFYGDHDGDGTVDTFANGYGSLPNGDQAGYLQQTALEAQAAAEAPDTTSNIIQQNRNIQVCIQNMSVWTDQILPKALQLQEMDFGPEMKPVLEELSQLGLNLSKGLDANKNGQVEIADGECGAESAYYAGVWMADFPIFMGANRMPPTVTPVTPENQ
jgi:hypothetical protein